MLEKIKRLALIKALYRMPAIFSLYHYVLSFIGALVYGFPSRKMTVIGVTGTKGKTSTCNILTHILSTSGYKTGMATTVNFRIGDKTWVNASKQTMLGRFQLQKLLRDMVKSGCAYAVVETSSEGILQYRHRFIDYDMAVFTNLSPEHIERHGSFENYRAAKVKLFEQVARKRRGTAVINLDDPAAEYFLRPKATNKYGYGVNVDQVFLGEKIERWTIGNMRLSPAGSEFSWGNNEIKMPLIGLPNVMNAAAAATTAVALNVPEEKIISALKTVRPIPGRMEVLQSPRGFTVVIDYAHEPASLEAIYRIVKLFQPQRLIGLLGSQGGGRDQWKRKAMGEVAARYLNEVVVTNEDPYDDDPLEIVNQVALGIKNAGFKEENIHKIVDRREGIGFALSLAKPGDAVVLTGKGGEVWMCVKDGEKIPWDERKITEELLAVG